MTLNSDAIFNEPLTGGLKNYLRNFLNFHASSHKSEDLHLYGLNNIFPPVWSSCIVTTCGVALEEEQPYVTYFTAGTINKIRLISK